MLFLKRLKILTLTMIAILVGLSAVPFQGKSYAEGTENTTEEPIFSFMSMSDTHSDTGKTAKAVTDAKNNNASAIVLVGDITNLGDSGEYDAIKRAIDSVKDHPPVHYTMGNHEYDWQSDYNVAKNRFIQKAGIPENKVYYHREIQGYDFLFLGFDRKPANIAYMSDEQLAWLESKLAENAEPDKPIFVFTHNPIYQTVSKSFSDNYGQNMIQEQKFRNILEKYPQAILTTGHLHDDVKIQGNMYTNRFTALRDGAVLNSQAMMFDVYKDKVHIKGRDVTTQKTIWEGTMSLHPNTTGMYEAEDSVFAYATSGDDINPSGGKYVNMNNGKAYIESLKVDGGASGGNKILKIRYATDAANATEGLYVNGARVQTLSFPTTGSMSSYNELAVPVELNPGSNNKIVIKSDGNAAGVNIDKFQIIDSADPSTMWGFNGNGNDSIKNGFNATLHGSAAYDTTDKMEGSASLNLNGADGNYASADLVSTKTDNVTLTAWVKWNGAASKSQRILSNGDGDDNGYSIMLDHANGDKVSLVVNGKPIARSETALTAGQWTNITAARRSGTWELYINGNSVPVTNKEATPATPTKGTYIGANSQGKQSFNGRIDAVRVYNQALSTDQIMAMANETSNVKLQSIEITKLPTKLNYLYADALLLNGLVVTGTYSDGTTKVENVTGDHITGFDNANLKAGLPLTVTVGGKTASFNVNILDELPGSASVPGRIEAANYNKKQGLVFRYQGTNDGGPAYRVNYIEKDDWMEYNVDVAKSGFYQLDYKVGTAPGKTGEVEFEVDGVPQTRTSFSTGGWDNYVIKSETVALSEGSHKIRLNVTQPFWVFRWFELTEVQEKKLNSITAPADIDAAIGTAKTADALGLPKTVDLVTDSGSLNGKAKVTWNVDASDYDPTVKTVQTFTVNGTVTLPTGVANPNNVPLTTSIRVTANRIPVGTAAVTASSIYNASFTPDKVFDGIGQAVNGEWASKGEKNPWIQVNWTTNQTFNKIIFYDRPNLVDWATGGTLTFSDGSTLTVSGIPNDGSAYSVTFPDKTVTWVKFQVSGGSGSNVGLSEMKILAPVDK
ncbi:carbohydrate-binding protein (plasmid) [Bacillus sp. F19]|nr:carbohydrate-binding protein [Bacillus sp. F19]